MAMGVVTAKGPEGTSGRPLAKGGFLKYAHIATHMHTHENFTVISRSGEDEIDSCRRGLGSGRRVARTSYAFPAENSLLFCFGARPTVADDIGAR